MPGIFRDEVLHWKPMSELTKHGDNLLVLCVMRHSSGQKYYLLKMVVNASGELKSLEKGLPLLSLADSIPCAWCYMPQGIDLSEEEDSRAPLVSRMPPKMQPKVESKDRPKLKLRPR